MNTTVSEQERNDKRIDCSTPIVIVHGFLATPMTNLPLSARLRREGCRTFHVDLPGLNTQDMRISSEMVAERVEDVMRRTGAQQVRMLGVSMGGLIALHYVRRGGGHRTVRRLVTLASPHRGTDTAKLGQMLTGAFSPAARQMHPGSDFIRELNTPPYPEADIVSFACVGDPMVPASAARLDDAKNVIAPHGVWPFGHYAILLDRRNYVLIRDALLAV